MEVSNSQKDIQDVLKFLSDIEYEYLNTVKKLSECESQSLEKDKRLKAKYKEYEEIKKKLSNCEKRCTENEKRFLEKDKECE